MRDKSFPRFEEVLGAARARLIRVLQLLGNPHPESTGGGLADALETTWFSIFDAEGSFERSLRRLHAETSLLALRTHETRGLVVEWLEIVGRTDMGPPAPEPDPRRDHERGPYRPRPAGRVAEEIVEVESPGSPVKPCELCPGDTWHAPPCPLRHPEKGEAVVTTGGDASNVTLPTVAVGCGPLGNLDPRRLFDLSRMVDFQTTKKLEAFAMSDETLALVPLPRTAEPAPLFHAIPIQIDPRLPTGVLAEVPPREHGESQYGWEKRWTFHDFRRGTSRVFTWPVPSVGQGGVRAPEWVRESTWRAMSPRRDAWARSHVPSICPCPRPVALTMNDGANCAACKLPLGPPPAPKRIDVHFTRDPEVRFDVGSTGQPKPARPGEDTEVRLDARPAAPKPQAVPLSLPLLPNAGGACGCPIPYQATTPGFCTVCGGATGAAPCAPCARCHGTGEITIGHSASRPEFYEEENVPCPVCQPGNPEPRSWRPGATAPAISRSVVSCRCGATLPPGGHLLPCPSCGLAVGD